MDKRKLSNRLTLVSLGAVLLSVFSFLVLAGPDALIYTFVTIAAVLSIIGVVAAVTSVFLYRKSLVISLFGALANMGILVASYFLLLSMTSSPT